MKWGRLIWDHRFLQMMLALYIPSLWCRGSPQCWTGFEGRIRGTGQVYHRYGNLPAQHRGNPVESGPADGSCFRSARTRSGRSCWTGWDRCFASKVVDPGSDAGSRTAGVAVVAVLNEASVVVVDAVVVVVVWGLEIAGEDLLHRSPPDRRMRRRPGERRRQEISGN